jgi:hypothetical protein
VIARLPCIGACNLFNTLNKMLLCDDASMTYQPSLKMKDANAVRDQMSKLHDRRCFARLVRILRITLSRIITG